MISIFQYISTLEDSYGLTRTLGEIVPVRDGEGRMIYSVGNSAIVFKVLRDDRVMMLKCYIRKRNNLRYIYGDRLIERELFVYTDGDRGEWVDVVLDSWIEGLTLHQAIVGAVEARDQDALSSLARGFDRLAIVLLSEEWAHGDLKPDNIIIDKVGEFHMIDFDAQYLPSMAGRCSPELGTKAYQHPLRVEWDFNSFIDDFPVALISTALHALSYDPSLGEVFDCRDGLLFNPQNIRQDKAFQRVLALFEDRGDALRLRIAEQLPSPTLHLWRLRGYLNCDVEVDSLVDGEEIELFVDNGYWGYRTDGRVVVPPIYDCGFEFSCGLAAVRIGRRWHFIDGYGRIVINCSDYEVVKPFKSGVAKVCKDGVWLLIDSDGILLKLDN